MFGFKKSPFKDGDYVFTTIDENDSSRIVVGAVEFAGPDRLKVAGLYIKPTGLIRKVQSGKAGPRSLEVLKSPHPDNLIHIMIDKVESGDFHDYVDIQHSIVVKIGAKRYTEIDNWIREGFPELFSIMLSSSDERKDEAKKVFMDKMHNMYDLELKHTVYAVARQLKLL
ncbi:MAG: hypothetical protein ACE5J2_01265 [Nitrososphaerales archaeon]